MKTGAATLTELGFDCLGSSPERDGSTLWLKSYGAHDLLVVLAETATHDDAVEAIYDAGARDARDAVREKWTAFQNTLKHASPAPSWEEARRRQRELREERERSQSMPHPADLHADGSPTPNWSA